MSGSFRFLLFLSFSSKHEALLDNFKSSYFLDKGESIEVRFYKQIDGSYLSIKCLKPSLTVVFINATLMIFCRFLDRGHSGLGSTKGLFTWR